VPEGHRFEATAFGTQASPRPVAEVAPRSPPKGRAWDAILDWRTCRGSVFFRTELRLLPMRSSGVWGRVGVESDPTCVWGKRNDSRWPLRSKLPPSRVAVGSVAES
jgi:hypothetical protein